MEQSGLTGIPHFWAVRYPFIYAVLFSVLLFGSLNPAAADQPYEPRIQTFLSENREFRVVLDPSQREAAIQGRRPTMARDLGGNPAGDLVTLQRSAGEGRWQTLWSGLAPGTIFGGSPRQALVRNDGQFVVTIGDNILSGESEQEVVTYDRAGRIIRSFSLVDLTSQFYFDLAPRSISSIQWLSLYDASFDQDQNLLLLPIADPGYPVAEDRQTEWADTFYVQRIRLNDGTLVPLSSDERARIQERLCIADFGRFAFETRLGSNDYGQAPVPVSRECVMARDQQRAMQKWTWLGAGSVPSVLMVAALVWWRRWRRAQGARQVSK